MKKNQLMKVVAVFCATLFFSSCSEEVVNSVPMVAEDACMVAKIDVKSIYQKSLGDGSQQSADLINALKAAVNNENLPQVAHSVINGALNNPIGAMGLDFNEPIYVSLVADPLSGEGGFYFTMAVSDVAMLQTVLEMTYKNIESMSSLRAPIGNGGNFYFYGFLVLTWLPRNAERDPEGFGAQQGPEKSGPRWVAGQIRG